MSPLLKGLLGNGDKERELAEEMRAILAELQQERDRCRVSIQNTRAAADRLEQLGEPVAKAGRDVDSVSARLGDLDRRLNAVTEIAARLETLDQRASALTQGHEEAAAGVTKTLAETQEIRSLFEDMSQKVDAAVDLKERLAGFLEVEKPFAELRTPAEGVRAHVDGTGEQPAKLPDQ